MQTFMADNTKCIAQFYTTLTLALVTLAAARCARKGCCNTRLNLHLNEHV